MTAEELEELIVKYRIRPIGNDKIVVPNPSRLSLAERAVIQAAKPEILEFFRQQAEAKRAGHEAERQAIIAGERPIQLRWHEGEVLSGWQAAGIAGKLLAELGLAHQIEGWGIHVPPHVVEALGQSFSYPSAAEFARLAQAKRARREAERAAKFQQAAASGEPVELARRVVECDGTVIGCSADVVIVYALPDGTIRETREHTS